MTTNYGLFEPNDNTPMANPDLFLDDNWVKIENILEQPVVSSLPTTDFSYTSGERVFHSVYNSTFICLGSNAAWGVFWRPVHSKYGPWIQLTNSVLTDVVNYTIGSQPLQYRITNDGRFQMRGSILRTAGVWPNYESTLTNMTILADLTTTEGLYLINPNRRAQFVLTLADQPASPTKPHVALFVVENNGSNYIRTWNASSTSTQLYFGGVEWEINSGDGYGV